MQFKISEAPEFNRLFVYAQPAMEPGTCGARPPMGYPRSFPPEGLPMFTILPLASRFHAPDLVEAACAALAAGLAAQGLATRRVEDASDAQALFLVTGGTEHLALEAAAQRPDPVLLLAHPAQNSLPAALEVLARLHQIGRQGRLFLINGTGTAAADLARTAHHLAVRARMARLRLGLIGTPSDWLVASRPDPARVTETWGPAVIEVPLADLEAALRQADPVAAEALDQGFRQGATRILEPSPADLRTAAQVAAALRSLVAAQRLDACSVRCFDLVTGLATTGCLGLSDLMDAGIVAGCEGDLPAALTMLWVQALTGRLSFMANPQDLDPAAGTLWLAHCTIARKLVQTYALRSHFESALGVGIQGTWAPGPVTLVRIGGEDLRGLYVAEGEAVACGSAEDRCRTQVQVRLQGGLASLLARPLGNHHILVPGHWAAELREYHNLFIDSQPARA